MFGSDGDFTLGSIREEIQRRSREQPRQPGEPRDRDGRALPRRRRLAGTPAAARSACTPRRLDALPVRAQRWTGYRSTTPCQSAFRVVDAANEYIAASEPWALAKAGRDAELDAVLWTAAEGAAPRGGAAEPGHAGIGRRNSRRGSARRWRRTPTCACRTMPCWQSSGDRQVTKGNALWPRLEAGTRR